MTYIILHQESLTVKIQALVKLDCSVETRAFRTRPFRRTGTRTQTEVRNLDSDSGSDFRNRDFPTP
jgi:hypothetical protein